MQTPYSELGVAAITQEWQDSTHRTWLDWGDRQCWAPPTGLGFPRAGPLFMYTPHVRLAEASGKQTWQDLLRTVTHPNVWPRRRPPKSAAGLSFGLARVVNSRREGPTLRDQYE